MLRFFNNARQARILARLLHVRWRHEIGASSNGRPTNWHDLFHLPPTLTKKESKTLIPLKNAPKRPSPSTSISSTHDDSASELDEGNSASLSDLFDVSAVLTPPKPGSFVELRRDFEAVSGIVLAEEKSVYRKGDSLLILKSNGICTSYRSSDTMFIVPSLVDSELISRCVVNAAEVDTVPSDPFVLSAHLKVLKTARDFERRVEQEFIRLGRKISSVYEVVRSKDPSRWAEISTLEAARLVDGRQNIPLITLFAVHKHLMNRPDEFLAQPLDHRSRHTFSVRPLSHLQSIRTVQKWLDHGDQRVDDFAAKAMSLIQNYRKTDEFSDGSPTIRNVTSVRFSDSDLEIIQTLSRFLLAQRSIQEGPYSRLVPAIIKKVGIHVDEINDGTVIQFLKEIGYHAPWQDIHSLNRDLDLSLTVDRPLTLVPSTASGPILESVDENGLYRSDPHEYLRHDFGDLPVFVIDDVNAKERDDGLSVEPIVSEPGSVWIHAHIADPTSIIPLNSTTASIARTRMETIYFIHKTWPMLPDLPALGRASLGQTSTIDSEQNPLGQNVLTFSTKIDPNGNIVDRKVRLGVVRNVTVVPYDDVDDLLGVRGLRYQMSKPFDPPSSISPADVSHLQNYRSSFELLYKTVLSVTASRRKLDTFTGIASNAEVTIVPPPPPDNPPILYEPRFYEGFPKLSYSVSTNVMYETGSRLIVTECMKLACRAASRFCLDYDIPGLRRVGYPMEMLSQEDKEEVLASRDDLCYVNPLLLIQKGFRPARAEYTTKAASHAALGVLEGEGYLRATSPLRRFVDMLGHWQVKAAICRAAGLPEGDKPPFSEEDISNFLMDATHSERHIKRAYRNHGDYWKHMYIWRRLQIAQQSGRPDEVLQNLEAYTLRAPAVALSDLRSIVRIFIPALGMEANIIEKVDADIPAGTVIRVNVINVSMKVTPRLELERLS